MEVGHIYTIEQSKGKTTGIVLSRQVENISWSVVDRVVTLCTLSGEVMKIVEDQIVNAYSERLKPPVRASLRKLYNLHVEEERIQAEMHVLKIATQRNKEEWNHEKERIKVHSDEFTMSDLRANFRSISSYSTDPACLEFSMSLTKDIAKYASPEQYSFLSREYDGHVYVYDEETCVKQYGIPVSDSEITVLKGLLKHTTLQKVSEGAGMGDKNSLCVYKDFHFLIQNGATYSQMKTECAQIEQWFKNKENQFTR